MQCYFIGALPVKHGIAMAPVPGSPVGPRESRENKASVSRSAESQRNKDLCPWEVGDISRLPFYLLISSRLDAWMDGYWTVDSQVVS